MLHRMSDGSRIGCGERVQNPYKETGHTLTISQVRRCAIKPAKGKKPYTVIEVDAYEGMSAIGFTGLDTFEPYQLGLVWRDITHAEA